MLEHRLSHKVDQFFVLCIYRFTLLCFPAKSEGVILRQARFKLSLGRYPVLHLHTPPSLAAFNGQLFELVVVTVSSVTLEYFNELYIKKETFQTYHSLICHYCSCKMICQTHIDIRLYYKNLNIHRISSYKCR